MNVQYVELDKFISDNKIDTKNNQAYTIFKNLKQSYPSMLDVNIGPWIAGGAVLAMLDNRDMTDRDIDIFTRSKAQTYYIESLLEEFFNAKLFFTSKNAKTYKGKFEKYQTITRSFFQDPEQLLRSFDFSICQWATDGEYLIYTDQAYVDWKKAILRHINPNKESDLLKRMTKYTGHGYILDLSSAVKITKWIVSGSDFFAKYKAYDE